MAETNILVVDDEQEIADLVEIYLVSDGYKVFKASNAQDGLDILDKEDIHLCLLDIMMPGMNGLEMCKKIRETNNIPIIMLSAKSTDLDKILGLGTGADDYVVKPFGVSELLARIRTTLRRADRLKMSQGAQRDVYQVQDLVVDITKHQVLLAGEQIHFTQNEFKILELLCIHAGKVLTYDFILEHVWGPYGGNNNNQILRVNMANIRRKLKEDPSKPKYIHTELGIGYRMLED